ncbi:MAG: hypothetical protein R3E01_06200 [Pirellulaceae bacterium]|nr:hypothetical protein [Planctomycetales bacterium]
MLASLARRAGWNGHDEEASSPAESAKAPVNQKGAPNRRQSQCSVDGILEVPMSRFDVAILVRLADVDAVATQSVLGEQIVVLRGEFLFARVIVDRGGLALISQLIPARIRFFTSESSATCSPVSEQ